jgi:uncharacterized protein YgiM (DUF1202 family)
MCLGIISTVLAQGQYVYVKTREALVREGLRARSRVVATVPRGERLGVLRDSRIRVKVRTQAGIEGYVPKMQVQDEPVKNANMNLGQFIVEDRSPEEMRTAVSGLGLMEAAEKMAEKEGIDPKAVEAVRLMEKLAESIKQIEVDQFIKSGGQK